MAIILVCPRCGFEQLYKESKSNAMRKRKTCICGHKFEVKITRYKSYNEKKKDHIKIAMDNLDVLDQYIIKVISEQENPGSENQLTIAKKLNRSQATISRHLKKLCLMKNPLIYEIKSGGYNVYSICGNTLSNHDDKNIVNYVGKHNIHVAYSLLDGNPIIDKNQVAYRETPMGPRGNPTWIKRHFKVFDNKLNEYHLFTINTKKAVVYFRAAGRTKAELNENIEQKAFRIKEIFEKKFNFPLGIPEITIDEKKDYTLCRGTKESLFLRKEKGNWEVSELLNDDTPEEDSYETDEESAFNIIHDVDRIDKIEKELSNIKNADLDTNKPLKAEIDTQIKDLDAKLKVGISTLTNLIIQTQERNSNELLQTRSEIVGLKDTLNQFVNTINKAIKIE